MTTRSASAFLLCLALAAFAAMVGYAFLRTASRQDMSGRSEMLRALARDASSSGLAHAFEQILADYNARNLEVATGNGPVTVSTAPNFLDGPYRAPFVSLSAPNRMSNIPISKDDVDPVNHVLSPLMMPADGYSWYDVDNGGAMIYDARGRYIEVNYHNVTRPSPSTTDPVPVTATRFTDGNAPVPERHDGLFLDDNLQRLNDGSIEERRRKARYRLRYAVGVEDLSGHLLTNPLARMDFDWKVENNDYRAIPRWIDHSANVLDNMVASWNSNRATALRLGHIFRGRGNASNADRAWSTGPHQGLPASFPMMFRDLNLVWHGMYGGNNSSNLGGSLYKYAGTPPYEPILANPHGGEILTPVFVDWPLHFPYVHAALGPQYSWLSQVFSIQGCRMPYTTSSSWWELGCDAYRSRLCTIYTPYGRAQRASAAQPADWKWYEGRVDTPWHVNLLTASPAVISQMLLAYLPPYLRTRHWTHEAYYEKIGVTATGQDIFSPTETIARRNTNSGMGWDEVLPGLDVLNDQLGGGFSEFPAPSSLHTDGTPIKPDYYQNPREPRPVEQRYPGPLCRSDLNPAAHDDLGRLDDLGKHIDVDVAMNVPGALAIGRCTHTRNPLILYSPGGTDAIRIWDETTVVAPAVPPPWPTTPRWKIVRCVDPLRLLYKSSYFWDMTHAMSTALSYARAVWVHYPNDVFDPRSTASIKTGFRNPTGTTRDMSLRDPLAFDTIEEIDALFLRQLGESFDAPGSRNAKNPIISKQDGMYVAFQESPTAVSNTIATLVANSLLATASGVGSAERGKVMERMLNDYRLSFFGASTRYVDFHPLDFDGDGRVMCSCYGANPAASHEEKLYRTNRWQPAGAQGKGPTPSDLIASFDPVLAAAPYNYPVPDPTLVRSPWFCVSGCFFIGKSHYYRIFTRGEVFDRLLLKPVAQQTLDAVLTVDPEAPRFPPAGRIASEQRFLFKQWLHSNAIVELPLQLR